MNKKNIKTTFREFLNEQKINERSNEDFTITEIRYRVGYNIDSDDVIVYEGTDRDTAQYKYDTFSNPKDYEVHLTMEETEYEYEYIYNEPIEDYPFSDYGHSPNIWAFVDANSECIASKNVVGRNYASDSIIYDVMEHFGGQKYSTIWIEDANGNDIGSIGLRISDHSQNPNNNRDHNYYISVVIADFDRTANNFRFQNEFDKTNNEVEIKFTSEQSANDIIDDINSLVSDIKRHHLKIINK